MENLGEELRYEKHLSREEEIALKNRRTGMTIFQISWIMAFLCLVIVNLQIRAGYPTWPPAGAEPLDRVLPTIATVMLVISLFLTRRATRAISHDEQRGFLVQWRTTLLIALGFMAVLVFEWATLPPVNEAVGILANGLDAATAATQYYSVFQMMTGFHGIHALVIGLYMWRVERRAVQEAYDSSDYWDIEAGAKLWYFVVIAWIIFYVVLYWL